MLALLVYTGALAQMTPRLVRGQRAVRVHALRADGKLLAAADDRATVKVWDVEDGVDRYTLRTDRAAASLAFSPDGNTLAVGTEDGRIKLLPVSSLGAEKAWDAARLLPAPPSPSAHQPLVMALAFSPRGTHIAAVLHSLDWEQNFVAMWELAGGRVLGRMSGMKITHQGSLYFSPDGRHLVFAAIDSGVRVLWAPTLEAEGPPLPAPRRLAVAVSAKLLAYGYKDGVLGYDFGKKEQRILVEKAAVQPILGLAFTAGDRILLGVTDQSHVIQWSAASGQRLGELTPEQTPLWIAEPVHIARDLMVAADADPFHVPGGMRVVELSPGFAGSGRQLHARGQALGITNQSLLGVAFEPSGQALAAGGAALTLWSGLVAPRFANLGYPLWWHPTAPVLALRSLKRFTWWGSPQQQQNPWSEEEPGITLWHTERRAILRHLPGAIDLVPHPDGHRGFLLREENLHGASVASPVLEIDLGTGATLRTLTEGGRATDGAQTVMIPPNLERLALGRDGRWLAAVQSYRWCLLRTPVLLWDAMAKSPPLALPIQGQDAVAVGAGVVASGHCDGHIELWDLREQNRLPDLGGLGSQPSVLRFSPDEALLALADKGGKIRVWQTGSWKPLAMMSGHEDEVSALAFSPDGVLLASASLDGTVRVWDARSGELRGILLSKLRSFEFATFPSVGDWLVLDPAGSVDGSPGAAELLRWQQGAALLPAHVGWAAHRQAGLLRRIMGWASAR